MRLRISPRLRVLIILFVFWFGLEPMIVPMVQALPPREMPSIRTQRDNAADFASQAMAPGEYLRHLINLRGANKAEMEDKACADWLTTISNTYMLMEPGAEDVPTWYSSLKTFKDISMTVKGSIGKITSSLGTFNAICRRTTLAFSFFSKFGKTQGLSTWGARVFSGWANSTKRAQDVLSKKNVFTFIQHMRTPETPKEAGKYFRWVKGKIGMDTGPGKTIRNAEGLGHTVGIGFSVLSFALNTYSYFTSDDFRGGREFSYKQVKTGTEAVFALATLVCMFVPGAQVVAIASLVWMIFTMIGNAVGELNKRWKEAYKSSYWFLYQQDPAFQTFYDYRNLLRDEEKSASLISAERDYGAVLMNQVPQNDDEKLIYNKQKRLYSEIEKQGVLMSYYYHQGCVLPDFDIERLKELWSHKASFMAWKPTQEEAEKNKKGGFFSKIGKMVNPMTYVKWGADKIGSRGYLNDVKKNDVKKVFFNPDYVLVSKFRNFYMVKDSPEKGIFDLVGLRIEQSPFNYVPLLEIETSKWDAELMLEALHADSFVVGTKELVYLRQQVKQAADELEGSIKSNFKWFGEIEKDLQKKKEMREALHELVQAYDRDKDGAQEELLAQCKKAFQWKWEKDADSPTPRNLLRRFKSDVELKLALIPNHLAQTIVDIINLGMNLKNMQDTAKLAQAIADERSKAADRNELEKDFTEEHIKKFLAKGEFLGVNQGKLQGFFNWLSGIYSPREDLEKFAKLYQDDVEKYSRLVDKACLGKNERDPHEMLRMYKEELAAFKEVTQAYEAIKEDEGLKIMVPSDNQDVFNENFDFICDYRVPIDLTEPPLPK